MLRPLRSCNTGNNFFQLVSLQDKLLAQVVITATMGFNLQCNNVARHWAVLSLTQWRYEWIRLLEQPLNCNTRLLYHFDLEALLLYLLLIHLL